MLTDCKNDEKINMSENLLQTLQRNRMIKKRTKQEKSAITPQK